MLKVKSGVDADYISCVIGLPERGKKHWLRGGWGNLYGGVYPGGEKLLSLDHILIAAFQLELTGGRD